MAFVALQEGLQHVTMGLLFASMGALLSSIWFMDVLLDYARPQ
jgi:hypothetical protein